MLDDCHQGSTYATSFTGLLHTFSVGSAMTVILIVVGTHLIDDDAPAGHLLFAHRHCCYCY